MDSRTLRATLANGVVVAIRPDTTLHDPNPTSLDDIRSLLRRGSHKDLLDFAFSVAPSVFPDADPHEPPERVAGSNDSLEFVFRLRGRTAVGVVAVYTELTHTINALPWLIDRSVSRVEPVIAHQAGTRPVETIYFVWSQGVPGWAREREEREISTRLAMPVQIWGWPEVSARLHDQGEEKPSYEIVLVETAKFMRELLRVLLRQPENLNTIDDRKFEELVATLLFDIGLQDVELTPARKDGGRDIIVTHEDRATGQRLVILIECKHWVSGGRATMRFAQKLLDVVTREKATAGVLLASNGFGPRLLEQEVVWEQRGVFLRDGHDLFRWLTVWERQYGDVLVRPVDPRVVLLGDTAAGPQ